MGILDLIFPKRCVGCGRIGKYFCDSCRNTVRIIGEREAICPVCERPAIDSRTHPRCRGRYTIDGLTSFFRYDGVVKKAVKEIKYRLHWDLSSEFVSLIPAYHIVFLTKLLSPKPLNPLVPIPLHVSRYRFRGFNQSEILGKYVAASLSVPMRTDVLKRIKKTVPQVEVRSREERLKNMHGVFAVNNHLTIQLSHHLFLFDDVFTTGATMRSAANVLKRAGAKSVWGITIAR